MKALLLFTLILLISSTYGILALDNTYVPADYIVLADKLTDEAVAELTKKYKMNLIGFGGGMAKCVNIVNLSFEIQGPLPKDRLREIIVDCVEEMLSRFNANEKIRPHLKTYPFTSKELDIAIFVKDGQGMIPQYPDVMLVDAFGGKVVFRTEDPNVKYGYKTTEIENYNTALEIVKRKDQSQNKSPQ